LDRTNYGIGLWQGVGVRRSADLAQLAEEEGFDHVWLSNHKLYSDMFVGLAAAAVTTRRIGLGTFVAEPYSQHPALIAAAIATVDELSGGRAILGLGAGGANFKELGIDLVRPAQALREAIQIIRPLLAGERIDFQGEVFTARDTFLHHLAARPGLRIVLASRGARVLQVAGEEADGAMIATYATPAGLSYGRAMVSQGLARAGRDETGFPLYTRVDVSMDEDGKAARDAIRPMIAAMVMSSYPDAAFLRNSGLEITPELAEMSRQKNEALAFASGHLVPDAYVERFAWVGTPTEVAGQIAAVVDAGFNDIVALMQPMGVDPGPAMRTFAREVIPRVKALLA
jgi:5,10-methylenetetrahydromethanopterin reductase